MESVVSLDFVSTVDLMIHGISIMTTLISCSDCLQTNNVCGWCVYSKVCSGMAAVCVEDEHFLQVMLDTQHESNVATYSN